MTRPTLHMPDFRESKYLAINGTIYRNTAAAKNAPVLLKIFPFIDKETYKGLKK